MLKKILEFVIQYIILQNKFPILMHHQVNDSGSPLAVRPKNFDWQMKFFYNLGYRSISLASFYNSIFNKKSLDQNSFLITFDDAFKSVLLNAKPILDKYSFKGVVFVPTKYIGKKAVYCSRKQDQEKEILNEKELRELEDAGWDIANHFHSHQPLTNLSRDEIIKEVEISQKILSLIVNKKENISYFAIPKQRINEEIRNLLKEKGVKLLFEGNGLVDKRVNLYKIPRVEIFDTNSKIKFLARFSPIYYYLRRYV